MIVYATPLQVVQLPVALAENETLKQQWQQVPYTAVQAPEVTEIVSQLNNHNHLVPSLLSETDAKKSVTIRLIDSIFIESFRNYYKTFCDATREDFSLSLLPRSTELDFSLALATGAARFSLKTPQIPVIKEVVGPVFALFGGVYGIIMNKRLTEERMNGERSVNRSRWFAEVVIKEHIRIEHACEKIKERVKVLHFDLTEMDQNLIDTEILDELKELDKIATFLAPNTPLKIDNLTVAEYLKQREIDD